ncbi:hypothetical protein CI105_03665 [Candidatus Izimaplasma bacterium ZiA1]|uniref:hypothetical protein n=1 Tax=Candidatus Izimoplasma sp. ZiA1 TaxID=2024899 RepID=UPI000BAA8F39|nr:hypothetical protein CI105_03665 [Candidatus Izimaplasma bacterium ZiA1]
MRKDFVIRDLIETDKLFCEECKLDGAKAWAKYMTKESIMVSGTLGKDIIGEDSIYKVMVKVFDLKNISFKWFPVYADVSDDATLGFTSGTYNRTYFADGKKVLEEGKYISIWKKVNNSWKISLDMGN